MRRLAIANQKGGAGKTTTAVNLAAALAARGRKVLVVDLDPEASASVWLGVRDGGRSLLETFTSGAALAVRDTAVPGVSLVPSSAWLVGAEKALASEAGAETILKLALERLPGTFGYALLDCPPALGVLTVNALAAAGELLAPVEASLLAVDGLIRLLDTVRLVQERLNPKLRLAGVLASKVDGRTRLAQDVVALLRERYPQQTLKTVIRENVRLGEAYAAQKPITTYDPHSAGAEDYRKLAAEIIRMETNKP